MGGAVVAEPAEREGGAVLVVSADVGEVGSVADVDAVKVLASERGRGCCGDVGEFDEAGTGAEFGVEGAPGNVKQFWPQCDALVWPHQALRGSGLAALGGAGGAEAVAVGAGFDDVGVEGEPVDHGGDEAGIGDDVAHSLKRRLEATAMKFFSSRSVMIWNSSSAPRVSSWT